MCAGNIIPERGVVKKPAQPAQPVTNKKKPLFGGALLFKARE